VLEEEREEKEKEGMLKQLKDKVLMTPKPETLNPKPETRNPKPGCDVFVP
jgi:hypothetical protein